jgi:hypothetical protein
MYSLIATRRARRWVPGQIGDGETTGAKRAADHVLLIEQGAKRKLESYARRVCFIKTAMRTHSRAAAGFHASHAKRRIFHDRFSLRPTSVRS